MSSAATRQMTVEEFLELPDDGVERWLIEGELRENGMTRRSRKHSYLVIRLGRFLDEWAERQPRPQGIVIGGEAGIRFTAQAETAVGVDVAYLSPEVAAAQTDKPTIVVGVPTLIVEVLSPSDKQQDVAEKVKLYLSAGVKHVWIVDPDFPSVRIHRPDAAIQLVNPDGMLTAKPDMPGLQIDLKRVFDR